MLREALEMAEEDPPLPVSMDAFCGRCGDGAGRETQRQSITSTLVICRPLCWMRYPVNERRSEDFSPVRDLVRGMVPGC